MEVVSFDDNIKFDEDKIVTKVILETETSKEIRILLKKGLQMKEHKAPFPITVHVLDGQIDFGVKSQNYNLIKGNILSLASNIQHNLIAKKNSVIRLTLSKLDSASRVNKVIE